MQLSLDQLLPLPLSDRLHKRPSDIWQKSIVWQASEKIKIKAPSGSGKSTFIHILWQLRRDYKGKVGYNGKDAALLSAEDLAVVRQTQLSIIFQDLRLFPQLTLRENIELIRVMHRPNFHDASRINEMADQLGIGHVLDQKASICSYGEQQRAAIIRSLMPPFQWLLMDEPFSHLDKKNAALAAAVIASEMNKRGAGCVRTDLEDDQDFTYTNYLQL